MRNILFTVALVAAIALAPMVAVAQDRTARVDARSRDATRQTRTSGTGQSGVRCGTHGFTAGLRFYAVGTMLLPWGALLGMFAFLWQFGSLSLSASATSFGR